jgi:hypothetical protein
MDVTFLLRRRTVPPIDGFNWGENYPGSYNGLAAQLAKDKKLGVSDCPNGLLGLGALGL